MVTTVPQAVSTITKRSTTVGSLGYDVEFGTWTVKGVMIHFEGVTVVGHMDGTQAITDSATAYLTSNGTTLTLDGKWPGGSTIITLYTPTANGADKIVNGAMAADTDWTKGAGWTIAGGKAVHATANATALVEAVSTIVNTETYLLTYTISTVTTAGTLTPSAGGVTLTGRTAAGTYSEEFLAASTAALTFTANATFAGTIDDIKLYKVTPCAVSLIAWV